VRGGAAGGVPAGGAVFRVKVIHCELTGCTTSQEVYDKILAALQAPGWHGHNLNALWDSIAGGGINELRPPYQLKVTGYGGLPKDQRDLVDAIGNLFTEARRDSLADVKFIVV
jgi:RNAse (barnase) inhibitor barstar